MDILIKNMEMPSCCYGCFCAYDMGMGNYACPFSQGGYAPIDTRRDDCPLVEIPPHGEAKDTDVAIRYIKSEMEDDFNKTTTLDEKSYKEGMKRAIELIGYAPTVLEAST